MGIRGDQSPSPSIYLYERGSIQAYRPKLIGLVLPCFSGSRSYFRPVLYLLNTFVEAHWYQLKGQIINLGIFTRKTARLGTISLPHFYNTHTFTHPSAILDLK